MLSDTNPIVQGESAIDIQKMNEKKKEKELMALAEMQLIRQRINQSRNQEKLDDAKLKSYKEFNCITKY